MKYDVYLRPTDQIYESQIISLKKRTVKKIY